MGNCSSCKFMPDTTAKLILLDGELEEYICPVKVWQVLEKKNNECFICDSDEMDFDEFVYAISDDGELEPGQLYFLLPVSWLTQPLQAADMASLAVKASLALKGRDEEKCGCWSTGVVHLLMFSGERNLKHPQLVGAEGGGGGKLARKLSMILEE